MFVQSMFLFIVKNPHLNALAEAIYLLSLVDSSLAQNTVHLNSTSQCFFDDCFAFPHVAAAVPLTETEIQVKVSISCLVEAVKHQFSQKKFGRVVPEVCGEWPWTATWRPFNLKCERNKAMVLKFEMLPLTMLLQWVIAAVRHHRDMSKQLIHCCTLDVVQGRRFWARAPTREPLEKVSQQLGWTVASMSRENVLLELCIMQSFSDNEIIFTI